MRKLDLFFATILVPLDYLVLLLAGVAAYGLRVSEFVTARRPVMFALPFDQYLRVVSLVALVWLVFFALSGLYTIGGRRKKFEEFKKIALASTAALGGELAVVVFTRELFESRFILLASWGFAIIFILTMRLLLRAIRNGLLRAGFGLKQVAVIGKSPSAEAMVELLNHTPKLGFKVVFSASAFDSASHGQLVDLARKHVLHQIIYVGQNGGQKEMHELLDFADEYHIPFRYSADLLTTHGAGLEFDTLAGVPLMEIKRTRLEGWGRVYKRIFDIAGSVLLIILTSPIMLLAAVALVVETGLPILYRNARAGEHGRVFKTLKFRTMYKKYCVDDSNEAALKFEQELIKKQSIKAGPVYKIKNDPRVTRVGRFLRRASIDELPQLFNVFFGTMSLVGPRPHQPREVARYEKHHKRVLGIKPGLTGLPQISGRSDLSFDEEVRLDTYYMEQWSLKLDFIILLKTPFAVAGQKGTY